MSERIIALIAGESGTGKSFFVANLPCALIYDTDIGGGLSYADTRIANNQSERVEISSYPEILADLKDRGTSDDLAKRHTVVIDHVSALQQEANGRHNPTGESDYGRANERATREWRLIREFCRRHDFNLICTGHMKGKWEKDTQIGIQIDGAKNMEGDVSIAIYLRRKSAGGYPSLAIIQKWRRDPEDTRGPVPTTFEFSLANFIAIDGTNSLVRQREPIKLASPEQVEEITRLLEVVKLNPALIERLWKKNSAESWAELPASVMTEAIKRAKLLAQTAANGATQKKVTK